nr:energy transducer TonB [Prevotella sp.]
MSKIDLYDPRWVNMVFAGRNQEYGAYKLRMQTTKRNILAIIIMLLIAAIFASIMGVRAIVEANKPKVAVTTGVNLAKIAQQKKKAKTDKKIQPKQEKKQEEVKQVKSSIKFTAPVIKKDEDVKPEDEMKSQNDLSSNKTAIGAFNVQGNDEGGAVLKATQTIITQEPPKHEEVTNKVFDVVEQMPSFPGGNGALMSYLASNIKYPVVAQENGVQGRVVVSFVVERDGSITDVNVVKSVDPSLDREAQRVVRSMPRWNPGKQNGSAVRVKYNVPVSFRLN